MRVLQIIPSISLVYGGPSQMVKGLSAALSDRNIEVTILTTNSNGDSGEAPLDVPLDRPVAENGYQIRYFPCFPFRRYKFSPSLLQWLSQHAKAFDLAHIHALFSPLSSAAATVCRQQHLPYLLRPLGTLDPADLRKKRQLKRIYTALWEKGNIAGASAIHFTSSIEAKVSQTFGTQTPGEIIPLGVQLPEAPEPGMARAKLGIAREVPLILYMSRIDPKKGLDLLVPALETLVNEKFEFQWVLAGGNPQNPGYVEQIERQIRASSLAQCTQFAGFVTGELKAALLQDADLFVLPSYYENFGIAVAEAIASGTPVVISTGVYIWEAIEQSGSGWVCEREVASLTDRLRLALSDGREREKRGRAGAAYARENYRWDAIAEQTITVYQKYIQT